MYVDSRTNDTRLLSWAPGDAQPTTVLTEPVSAPARAPSAAYTADGRLWVSWTDDVGGLIFAKLGDANGAGGSPLQLQLPAGFRSPQISAALAAGNSLTLVTNWLAPDGGATTVWATVVALPVRITGARRISQSPCSTGMEQWSPPPDLNAPSEPE